MTMFRNAALAATILLTVAGGQAHADAQLDRGKYLVSIGGCNDCHTPGSQFGKPEMSRYLAGSNIGFEIPGLGVFVPRNLTPDKETGLGNWTAEEIITALTTGKRPDGRVLAPVMPWQGYSVMTKEDSMAVAMFLKSIPPVKNVIPGPFGPNEKIPVFVDKIVPGDAMSPPGK